MKRDLQGGGALRMEWPTLGLVMACYAAWAAVGFLLWPHYPAVALVLLAFILALQSSLMHEATHGHPTRKAWINELLVGLPVGLVWPYRRFRTIHLRHHADDRLTDPFDDPESYYQSLWKHRDLPAAMRLLLRVNNTMLGRLVLNPWLGSIGFVIADLKLMAAGDRSVRRAWVLHAAGLAIVLPVVAFVFQIPLWLYVLVPVWLGQSLISIRTFAEHQWSERPDGRTIIVERSPLSFLFLNNNLHFVHHKAPSVAWYRLPGLFREKREEWIRGNGGYVYAGYLALLRAYALRAKEPVVHPVLRRQPEPGRAYRPRVRVQNVAGLGTAAVPAQPPKD